MKPGDVVTVVDRGKRLRGVLDSAPEFGWVCVVGLPGRAGSVSVRVRDVSVTA